VTDQQFVYRRGQVVVALNNDTTAASVTLPVIVHGRDVLQMCEAPVAADGRSTIRLPARTSCVFAP
jgi:hypothetical protein